MKERATLILCSADLILWGAIIVSLFFAGPEYASSGFGLLVGVVVTFLVALTVLPAYLLNRARREPTLALVFALAFPVVFLFLFLFVTTMMI